MRKSLEFFRGSDTNNFFSSSSSSLEEHSTAIERCFTFSPLSFSSSSNTGRNEMDSSDRSFELIDGRYKTRECENLTAHASTDPVLLFFFPTDFRPVFSLSLPIYLYGRGGQLKQQQRQRQQQQQQTLSPHSSSLSFQLRWPESRVESSTPFSSSYSFILHAQILLFGL